MLNLTELHQKKIFWSLLALLFIVCLIVTPQYGITGDEVTQWKYGDLVWKYIKTFGGDRTIFTDAYVAESPLKYYGGFYDGVAAMLIDIFHPRDEFLLRHFWNITFGFAGVILGGLLARELTGGWRAAIITVIFLVVTPRYFGELFNNPKDIPFTTGYLAALLCIIRWLKKLENPSWKTTIWLGLSIALSISVRIGGILVIAYLGLFYLVEMWRIKGFQSKIMSKTVLHVVVAIIIGWIGACLWWPNALEDIVGFPIETLKVMSAYPLNITTLYEGVKIRTTDIPAGYLLKWISIGTPLYILIGFIGSLAFIVKWTKSKQNTSFLLVLFATVFPVFYIIYKKSVVYDGMRHIMFVLPLLSLFAALFVDYLLQLLENKKIMQGVVVCLTLILLALPARFMFANHPNEYTYFNELAGGIKGAYGNYETDYYFNSLKGAFVWLVENKLKNAKPTPGHDSVLVASNAPEMMKQYINISGLPVKLVYVRYYQRGESDWDYGIFMSRFLDKEQLQNGYFPGDNPLHIIEADGMPLTTVLENDPERNVMKANEAMKTGNDTLAVKYLNVATRKYPHDAEAWRNLAVASFQSGNKQAAVDAVSKAYALSSLDMNNANTAGMIYLQAGDFNKAIQTFGKLTQDYPDAGEGWMGLGQAQAGAKNFPLAIDNINKAIAIDPRFTPQGYMILAYIYQQKGDMAQAQKYAAAAQQAGGR
jgi:tetratricopeptide (TPR) repeat protein